MRMYSENSDRLSIYLARMYIGPKAAENLASWADNRGLKDISPNRIRVISVFGGLSFLRAQKTSRQISHCSRIPGFGEFCGPR